MSIPSKNEFAKDNSISEQKSPIEFIAEVFWEDFEAQRPINGGVLCEDKLRQCQLDGSIQSLRRLDALLDELRLQWLGKETLFVQDERNRNLLLFIGFYMGKVLSQAWQVSPQWLSEHEIKTHYPHLKVQKDKVYHFMALNYLPSKHHTSHESRHLFFVLEPIATRLFTNSEQLSSSVQGDNIDKGIFDAVFRRLPLAQKEALLEQMLIEKKSQTTSVNVSATAKKVPQQPITNINAITPTKTVATAALQTPPLLTTKESVDDLNNSSKVTKAAIKNSSKVSAVKKVALKRQDDFTKLRDDLYAMIREQEEGDTLYQQADKVLLQFDQHIAKLSQKGKTLEEITFSEQHQLAQRQALAKLSKAVKLGNTDAMLRLAIAYFLGEGVNQDIEKGTALIKKAAREDDPRAQRQLSRLYYQGLGVSQDTTQGLHWLETAADNGHKEAKELLEQWHSNQTVIDERKYDVTTDRRYLLLVLIALIVAVVIFIMV
ncbi:tetratricopeptide repeat protein [Psychrobacter sp. I-STPA10]|uniref:tetratricopeptide repeat protein n=1 Tax=Psychrobacter sp. I-STPA10 TaxID=2585769 RepID=UPI001E649FD6|nr:tetratricopeptide repeat protein [Psychrobacter sp. I-STPA10]